MKRSSVALAASAAAAAVLAGALLAKPLLGPKVSDWLKVEAPLVAERDWPFTVVVRLAAPEAGTFLTADLHGLNAARDDLGFAAGSPAARVEAGKAEYSFELTAPQRGDVAYVSGLIYLSKDGSWEGRTKVAGLDPVPLEGPGASAEKPLPWSVKAYPQENAAEGTSKDIFSLQAAVAAIWAACAALSLARSRRPASIAFSLLCLFAAFCELVLIGSGLTASLRDAARAAGAYVYRRASQRVLSLAALCLGLAGAAAILVASIRARKAAIGAAWLGLCGYWAFLCLRFISFHYVDVLLAKSVGGLSAGQAARAVLAALSLAAVALSWAAGRRGKPVGAA